MKIRIIVLATTVLSINECAAANYLQGQKTVMRRRMLKMQMDMNTGMTNHTLVSKTMRQMRRPHVIGAKNAMANQNMERQMQRPNVGMATNMMIMMMRQSIDTANGQMRRPVLITTAKGRPMNRGNTMRLMMRRRMGMMEGRIGMMKIKSMRGMKNMQRMKGRQQNSHMSIDEDSTLARDSTLVDDSTTVAVDCGKPINFMSEGIVALVADPEFVTNREIQVVKTAFVETYNQLTFENCDGYFREIRQMTLRRNDLPQQRERHAQVNSNSTVFQLIYQAMGTCRNCPVTNRGEFELFDDSISRRFLSSTLPLSVLGNNSTVVRNLQENEDVCFCLSENGGVEGGVIVPNAPSENEFIFEYNIALDQLYVNGFLENTRSVVEVKEVTDVDVTEAQTATPSGELMSSVSSSVTNADTTDSPTVQQAFVPTLTATSMFPESTSPAQVTSKPSFGATNVGTTTSPSVQETFLPTLSGSSRVPETTAPAQVTFSPSVQQTFLPTGVPETTAPAQVTFSPSATVTNAGTFQATSRLPDSMVQQTLRPTLIATALAPAPTPPVTFTPSSSSSSGLPSFTLPPVSVLPSQSST